MLLVQADRSLGSIFLLVKQTEKLAVILPIPAGITHMDEAFALYPARDFSQRRKTIRGRRAFRPERFFFWQPERANARKDLKPRQNERAHGCRRPKHPAPSY